MKDTKPLNASDPAPAVIYEFSGRRYIVRAAYQENRGSSIAELLLRIMVNDGNTRFGNHDSNERLL